MFCYKATPKEILKVRKGIFLQDVLPILKEKGFIEAPFKTACFGWCGFGYIYNMCRLKENKFLEFMTVNIVRGDKHIQIFINAFEVHPLLNSLSLLKETDGLKYFIPPNNKKEMRLDVDFIKGHLILSKDFWFGTLKLGGYYTKKGYSKQVKKLKEKVKSQVCDIDSFFDKWYIRYRPNQTR